MLIKNSEEIFKTYRLLLNASSVKTMPSNQTRIVKGLYIELIKQSSHKFSVLVTWFFSVLSMSLVAMLIVIITRVITNTLTIQ